MSETYEIRLTLVDQRPGRSRAKARAEALAALGWTDASSSLLTRKLHAAGFTLAHAPQTCEVIEAPRDRETGRATYTYNRGEENTMAKKMSDADWHYIRNLLAQRGATLKDAGITRAMTFGLALDHALDVGHDPATGDDGRATYLSAAILLVIATMFAMVTAVAVSGQLGSLVTAGEVMG